jgi:hypothetical protein
VEILTVGTEVIREVVDAAGEDGDLDFRRTGILGILLVLLDDIRLIERHDFVWVFGLSLADLGEIPEDQPVGRCLRLEGTFVPRPA